MTARSFRWGMNKSSRKLQRSNIHFFFFFFFFFLGGGGILLAIVVSHRCHIIHMASDSVKDLLDITDTELTAHVGLKRKNWEEEENKGEEEEEENEGEEEGEIVKRTNDRKQDFFTLYFGVLKIFHVTVATKKLDSYNQ